jgi:mannan polymerase II complex MNN10 subunit
MLARKLSNPPLIAILLVTLIFLLWSINWSSLAYSTASMIPKSADQRHNRIAIVTFITDQKSYIHLSLRNKDRKSDQIFGFI